MIGGRAARLVAASNAHMAQEMRGAAREVAKSNDRLAHTLSENSQREVAARDRVDITLTEYLKLKQDIAELSEENRYLKALYGKIGLPYDVPILPDSIRKYQCFNIQGCLDFTHRFLLEFKCDMSSLSSEQRRYMSEEFIYAGGEEGR